MKRLERVVWSEGMHLGPHHFQAQARYFEDSIHFAATALWFAGYGLIGCELDAEALRNGTVALVHARGIFPDGLAFHMPESDPLPAPRPIAELFPPLQDRMVVYLGVPAYRPDGVNCALEDGAGGSARYIAAIETVGDENTGRDEKPVRVGRKNIRFCLETELSPDLVTLPVARVMRSGGGQFVYDPEFIPPCLRISASSRLMYLLNRLIEILGDKSAAFQRQPSSGLAAGFSQREVFQFWFLHSVNTALATLRNLCLAKRCHPEEAFVELSRLAGALCTFGLETHPANLPLYEHDRLDACFHALDEHIRRLLETIIPTQCISIPLEPAEHYLHFGEVRDQRCLGRAQWILSLRAHMGEADLIRLAPLLVKICSKEFTPRLVERALPGMQLTHLSVPPSAVSPRVECQYFAISRAGPCWEHILKTRQVGVYVPGEFPDPEIGLHVILES